MTKAERAALVKAVIDGIKPEFDKLRESKKVNASIHEQHHMLLSEHFTKEKIVAHEESHRLLSTISTITKSWGQMLTTGAFYLFVVVVIAALVKYGIPGMPELKP